MLGNDLVGKGAHGVQLLLRLHEIELGPDENDGRAGGVVFPDEIDPLIAFLQCFKFAHVKQDIPRGSTADVCRMQVLEPLLTAKILYDEIHDFIAFRDILVMMRATDGHEHIFLEFFVDIPVNQRAFPDAACAPDDDFPRVVNVLRHCLDLHCHSIIPTTTPKTKRAQDK